MKWKSSITTKEKWTLSIQRWMCSSWNAIRIWSELWFARGLYSGAIVVRIIRSGFAKAKQKKSRQQVATLRERERFVAHTEKPDRNRRWQCDAMQNWMVKNETENTLVVQQTHTHGHKHKRSARCNGRGEKCELKHTHNVVQMWWQVLNLASQSLFNWLHVRQTPLLAYTLTHIRTVLDDSVLFGSGLS